MPIRLVAPFLLASVSCAVLHSCVGEVVSNPSQITDGVWEFQVDREWAKEGAQVFPTALTEEDYRSLANGPRYSIVVTEGCAKVEIREVGDAADRPAMKGERRASGDPFIYWLQDGTFAGGQFVVLPGGMSLQAELTIFGSGVPITASERGSLSKKR